MLERLPCLSGCVTVTTDRETHRTGGAGARLTALAKK